MKHYHQHIVLLLVAILAYGLLIPQLGFYWDDLPISWIRYQLGPEALTRYFSTNRPIWGLLYQVTTSVIPHEPIYWQIFALFWRWLGAVTVFAIANRIWKDKPRFALSIALIFLVYPGFNQQWASFLYSHFFIVLFFFLFSLLCMVRAIEEPNRYGRWTLLGILFSALNLWMTEYFYVLELVRVGFILAMLRNELLPVRERVVKTFKLWIPYLAVFILAVLSRLFIFNNQIYGMGLTDQIRSTPVETLKTLAGSVELSLRLVLKDAWLQAMQLPDVTLFGSILNSYYLVVAGVIIFSILGYLLLPADIKPMDVSRLETVLSSKQEDDPSTRSKPLYRDRLIRRFILYSADSLWAIGLGIFAVLLAGAPFWLIGFTPSLAWPASRFTLPFMLGVGFILTGIIALIPLAKLKYLLVILLVGLAAGRQFLWSYEYKQDWETQKDLFWQLSWRAPGIQPDTAIIMNEGALKYYADNSLSPVVNWIYAPDNHSDHVNYVLLYPTTRLRSDALPKLEPDLPIFTDYLAGTFHGNTSRVLAIYFAPPGCLRILDPEIERVNRLIPEQSLMRFASRLTNMNLITAEETSRMPKVYGPEPEHGFCYYFQKAEQARQFKEWDQVVELAEVALKLNNHSIDPAERFVFIEGYAHAGDWERAIALSKESYEFSPEVMGEMLCRLWKRVEVETDESAERDALNELKRSDAFSRVHREFRCDF